MRGYGFQAEELFQTKGDLPLDIDPKLAWALANRQEFPVDLNRAPLRLIARVPGIGMRNAQRLVELRRLRAIRYQDLILLRCAIEKVKRFIVAQDYRPSLAEPPSEQLRRALAPSPAPQQLSLL